MKKQALPNEKIDKLIKDKYNASFMNNAKWVKLIQLLVTNYSLLKSCQVKLIYDDKIRHMIITGNEAYNFDFYSTSMESMVAYPMVPGWTLYKEIEWINFPVICDGNKEIMKQYIAALRQSVNGLGKFNEEVTDEYYRIYAYK
ncbi:hypothetical protein GXP67_28335 [Rhodocytophaga rosea]|uniref:Uncharacterized protein n=1 Tax=Rhodocytophaga rosea TaxID=2704465 RepID=A0A6C0GQE3_9BACT|nr:hypothetical protein [Rhodocytophaga rosea]QHT70281.1 hypothetical protein GXP67_28335 [Rhodocytophaga rosea]